MLDLMIKLYLLKSCVQFKMRIFLFFRRGPFCLAKPVVASSGDGSSGREQWKAVAVQGDDK